MKKLWIDDVREAPKGWVWAKTSSQAMCILATTVNTPDFPLHISFDHDLGGDDTTIPVANLLEEMVEDGTLKVYFNWSVHSANPVGSKTLNTILEKVSKRIYEIEKDDLINEEQIAFHIYKLTKNFINDNCLNEHQDIFGANGLDEYDAKVFIESLCEVVGYAE